MINIHHKTAEKIVNVGPTNGLPSIDSITVLLSATYGTALSDAVKLLEKAEWTMRPKFNGGEEYYCLYCHATKGNGLHCHDCELATFLETQKH